MVRGTMLSSLFVYVVLVEYIHRTAGDQVQSEDATIVRFVLYGIAIATVFSTQVAKGIIMRAQDKSVAARIKRLSLVNIITAALAEVPVILGLVMFFLWQRYSDFYVLGAISLYLLLRHYPRYAGWEDAVKGLNE